MVQRNLGTVDRILRFALAFWWLGPWAPIYLRVWFNWILFAVGWIALIESFFGYCWLHKVLKIKTRE